MSEQSTPGPIDFSALDPSRHQVRWERTIQNLAARAWAERQRRTSIEHQLLSWAGPVLAVAAVLCLMLWSAGYLVSARRVAAPSATAPALQLAAWAANDKIPETSELFGTLGGNP